MPCTASNIPEAYIEQPAIVEKPTYSKDAVEVGLLKKQIKGEFAGRFLCGPSVNVHVCRTSRQTQQEYRVVMPSKIQAREGENSAARKSL